MDRYDFVVVGGGIAGASAGFELARRGKVLLIERESQFGYHSTGRSAALYLQTHGPDVIRAMAKGSNAFLTNPPDGFSEYPLLKRRTMLYIGRADQASDLDRAAEECARAISGVRRLDFASAREMVPVLREEYVAGAVFDPAAMDIDVHAVHYGFLRQLRQLGGRTIADAELLSLELVNAEWVVRTRAGNFVTAVVVNAAGAWADKVAMIAGVSPLGLVPKRRTVLIFDPPEGIETGRWPAVHDIGETFYFKPDAGKLLGSPADETPIEPCDAHPDDLDVAVAVERIQKAAALPVKRINRKWAGLRSFVRDGRPVVGYDPKVAGFFWLAGQGGYGIETSPAMGRTCASLATGNGIPTDIADLGVTAEALSPARLTDPENRAD